MSVSGLSLIGSAILSASRIGQTDAAPAKQSSLAEAVIKPDKNQDKPTLVPIKTHNKDILA
jgi:hypothetical protein